MTMVSSVTNPVHMEPETTGVAPLIIELLQRALVAPSVAHAVVPMLECLAERTAAVGAAYFQASGTVFTARASSGIMPAGPAMDRILVHGLPFETPLLQVLRARTDACFFDDTQRSTVTLGFPELGVTSLAAAPVHAPDGDFLGAFLMHTLTPHQWTLDERHLFTAVSKVMANLTARLVAEERTAQAHEDAMRALGLALETRDAETKGHTDRVSDLAVHMAKALDLSPKQITAIRWGAYLHDIGKIGIPDAILHKPGALDSHEIDIIRQHPSLGAVFAEQLAFLPPMANDIIYLHHERWDGCGYPLQLSRTAIPLAARIFAICDVYDALTNARPYKQAWPVEQALNEIQRQAGAHFDPDLVALFIRLIEQRQRTHYCSAL
jgi:putative nucleotidyltransferase with HDIG domain